MSYSPEDIQKAVDSVFEQYDFNRNNLLEINELMAMINSGLRKLNKKAKSNPNDAKEFLAIADINHDDYISRAELLHLFTKILARQ
jgi:Ca2+-binding EF-hand superfamily protein